MKTKVFCVVGIFAYETSDDIYKVVGIFENLSKAQAAMKTGYNMELEELDGDLPDDLKSKLGKRTAFIEYSEHHFSWEIYEQVIDAEPL